MAKGGFGPNTRPPTRRRTQKFYRELAGPSWLIGAVVIPADSGNRLRCIRLIRWTDRCVADTDTDQHPGRFRCPAVFAVN